LHLCMACSSKKLDTLFIIEGCHCCCLGVGGAKKTPPSKGAAGLINNLNTPEGCQLAISTTVPHDNIYGQAQHLSPTAFLVDCFP
jgi:hypothetical protein